ncbi:hypothetical protein HYFRA_00003062 [Hymenoscyphus fraxineus]|uniref:Uncharacterized protein n=1 Tax=Hymenoscyphus fraxineus TaxID=746836 RepID=A0A9N9KN22_9HELO|nr:hypothetical protein HYFRA_00003062 [Hymenoscyphus fraxineus]
MADRIGRQDDGLVDSTTGPVSPRAMDSLSRQSNPILGTLMTLFSQLEQREKERDRTEQDLRQRIANLENQLNSIHGTCNQLEQKVDAAAHDFERISIFTTTNTTAEGERHRKTTSDSDDTLASNTDASSISSSENVYQSKEHSGTSKVLYKRPRPTPEDICFAPRPNTNKNTTFAVSKNTNPTRAPPTTPKFPEDDMTTIPNQVPDNRRLFCTPIEEDGLEGDMQAITSASSNLTSLFGKTPVSSVRGNECRSPGPSPVSPTKNPNNRRIVHSVSNKIEAIEASIINPMQSKSAKRPSTSQDPLASQTSKRAKHSKPYNAPVFPPSSPSSSPEATFVLGNRWDTIKIGSSEENPVLKGSGLHREIIKMIRRKDSSNMNGNHRRKNMCRNTMEVAGPVVCWLSQNFPLAGWEGPGSRPGGRKMCNQCAERERRGLNVECFYFETEDRIVVFR